MKKQTHSLTLTLVTVPLLVDNRFWIPCMGLLVYTFFVYFFFTLWIFGSEIHFHH